jgi:hypothetical protein
VPKVAGQSIEAYISDLEFPGGAADYDQLLRFNPSPEKGPRHLAHLTLSEYLDLDYVTASFFQNSFKFGFTRCPWQRLVSAYNFRLEVNTRLTFFEWIECSLLGRDPDELPYDGMGRQLMPQVNYFMIDGSFPDDLFIGKLENISTDFQSVQMHLKLPFSPLPHKNTSNSKIVSRRKIRFLFKRRKFYSKDWRDYFKRNPFNESVREFYDNDFKSLGYDHFEIC